MLRSMGKERFVLKKEVHAPFLQFSHWSIKHPLMHRRYSPFTIA